jgi:rSAM/selenodomain-associated transferase 2
MRISVIIPVLNEEKTIATSVAALHALRPDEVLIVDGGSTDRTREICNQLRVRVISSKRGRATQMNAGASQATGDVLLFVHADTRLPESAFADIRTALANAHYVGGRFDVKLDGDRWILKIIGKLISLRSRLTKVSTGDQAIFVRRAVFEAIGGYPAIPLMEDIALSQALKRSGKVACLKNCVITSPRRWEAEGIWKTIFKMWTLKSLYLLGVSPFRLKRYYADGR